MPLTMPREAFLARLNKAVSHYGLPEVTDDILADWLEAKVIPSPRQTGRLRIWTRVQYRHALEILRLKSQGVASLAEIRWHLWIMGFEIPVFSSRFSSRASLIRIFRRDLRELFKPVNSKYQPTENETKKDAWRANALIRSMGDLDPELQKTVTYERDELLNLYGIAKLGGVIGKATSAVGKITAAMSKPFLTAVAVDGPEQKSILKSIARFAGNPHEEGNRAEKSLSEASEADFRLARRAFKVLATSPWPFGPKARRSFATPRWRIGLFVWLLHVTNHGGGKLMGLSMSEIDRIPDFVGKYMIKNK